MNALASTLPLSRDFQSILRVHDIWGALLFIVKQLPHNDTRHDQLIAVLVSLQGAPPPPGQGRIEYEEICGRNSFWKALPSGQTVWSDVELDAPLVPPLEEREGYISRDQPGTLPGPWRAPLSEPQWTILNAFAARLHVAAPGVRHLDVVGLLWLLEALEMEQPAPVLDDILPAAACWIIYAGDALRRNRKPYAQWAESTVAGDRFPWSIGPLYGGRGLKRFCAKRWEFWRVRFEVMRVREDLGEATKEYAQRAVEEMERLDGLGEVA